MQYLDQNEIRALLRVAYERDRLFWLAALVTVSHGLRISELLSLTVGDLHIGPSGPVLRLQGLKGGLEQESTLHSSADPLFDEATALCLHAHGLKKIGERYLFTRCRQRHDQLIRQFGAEAGIDPRKLHWHALRHSHGHFVFRETLSLGAVKQALRHRSIRTSLIYLQERDNAQALEARDRALHSISGGLTP